ncbi:MAG: hypothetical protein ABI650_02670, partial [Dokdonella sp.]
SDRWRALRTGITRLDGIIQAQGSENTPAGPVSGGRQRASGTGRADGCTLGTSGGSQSARGPRFDGSVASNGYAWWYVDALSDDGQHGITLIAFIGSVFSPYYAWARRRGPADPANHCAFNIALYGAAGKRWAMTERGVQSMHRDATHLQVGRSIMRWNGDALQIDVDEICVPLPRRIRGSIRVLPNAIVNHTESLDLAGRHRWHPLAPSARIEVKLETPALHWSGDAYLDSNDGDEPIENAIRQWCWSRADVHDGCAVLYDVHERSGAEKSIALSFARDGTVSDFAPPPRVQLPSSGWRIRRETRSDNGMARVERTLEDTPFYARSLVDAELLGQSTRAVHESLDLDRFRAPVVQAMLPFRMPRRR